MRSPLRLAFVITELEVGGAEKCLTRLACDLDPARFSVQVYSIAGPPRGSSALVQQLAQAGIPTHFLDAHSVWQFPHVRRRLRRLLAGQGPDIVMSFLFHANVLCRAAVGDRYPLILGVRVAEPSAVRLWFERRAARRAVRVVCVSQTVADYMERRAGFSPQQLLAIPNGIDPQPYQRADPLDLSPLGIAPDRRVLLFLGRLERQKGIDWLLQLAPKLLAELPAHDLVIAGRGSFEANVRREIRRLSPPARVHALGWQADPARLLRRADLLLLPSRWEGMPNVLLEAIAADVPVVATDMEGVREVLGPAADMQTTPFGAGSQFVQRAIALVRHAPLRQSAIAANRARLPLYTVPRMVKAYEDLFDGIHRAFSSRAG